jgi:cytochrome c-type biogenesis protein CcmH/NrfG
MDDTILSESHLMVRFNPNRYMAWWEMAQIYTKRKQYKNALGALNQHIARSPRRNPAAEQLRKQLTQVVNIPRK